MKTKLITFCGAAALAATSVATAAISITLDLEVVKDSSNQPINDQGLLVLVVDTENNGFSQPVAGEIIPAASDDEVVATWDLSMANIPVGQDYLQLLKGGIPYSGTWEAGQKLALMWFPNLATGETPAADEQYGFFTDVHGLASGDTWTLPVDNDFFFSLKLFTSIADNLVPFGDFPDALGKAMFAVNSPPGSVDAITVVTASASSEKIDITWQGGASGSGGFIIQRSSPGSGNWRTVGFANANQTSFSDTSIKAGLSYSYRVLSGNGLSYALAEAVGSVNAERSVFANVSARSKIIVGDDKTKMFGGVVVGGTAAQKNVTMQSIGRSFLGGANWVQDPSMALVRNDTQVQVASNDDWLAATNALDIDTAMDEGSAVPLAADGTSKDATILTKIDKNVGYSFSVESKGGDNGEVLLGIFDADSASFGTNDNRIVNLSARGFLDTGVNDVFAGGMIIEGSVPKEVLVMGWGPYLSGTIDPSLDGLTLADPELKLRVLGNDTVIATNDDWEQQSASISAVATVETDVDRIKSVVSQIGFPLYDPNSSDALLLVTLDPGAYTFEIAGGGGSGITLIAINEVEIE